MTKIFIDPGHGGRDPGAVGNGLQEKNLTLSIAKKIESILNSQYKNVNVMLSRSGDTFLSLTERTNKANSWGADCYLSPHINSASNISARGFSSYVYKNVDARTIAFQNVLHEQIWNAIRGYGSTDRGKLKADFHVLRETRMIALLTENLFIVNPSDAALLKQDEFINQVAHGHALGLERFFGLERVATPPPPPTDTLYQVITGTFSSRENAEKQVAKLKASGYESYIVVKK